jgi:hypothetical protein
MPLPWSSQTGATSRLSGGNRKSGGIVLPQKGRELAPREVGDSNEKNLRRSINQPVKVKNQDGVAVVAGDYGL